MKRFAAEFDVREKAPLIAGIILGLLGINMIFAFLVNVPRARRTAALDDAVAQASQVLVSKQEDVARLREHYSRVMEGRQNLDKFYSDILSTKQLRLISFQKEIRDIAKKFNINVETITYPREVYPKDKVARFSATMPLSGSYENLREFIDTIEKSDNFIVIDAIQLTNSKEGGVILSLSIQLSTYFVDPDIKEPDIGNGGSGTGTRTRR